MFNKSLALWTEENEAEAVKYYSELLNSLSGMDINEDVLDHKGFSSVLELESKIMEVLSLHFDSGCTAQLQKLLHASNANQAGLVQDKYGLCWNLGSEKAQIVMKMKNVDIEELNRRIGISDYQV